MIEYKLQPEDVIDPNLEGIDDGQPFQEEGGWRCQYRDTRGRWHHFVICMKGVPDTRLTVEMIRQHASRERVEVDA